MMDGQPSSSSTSYPSLVRGVGIGMGEAKRGATSSTVQNNFIGKHRMAAAISQLNHQINIIQEELDQLDALGESSIVCKELFSSVESVPDPLLPRTQGPVDIRWERWFRGAHECRSHKRWI